MNRYSGYSGYDALTLAVNLVALGVPAGAATDTAIKSERFFAAVRAEKNSKANALRRTAHAARRASKRAA